MYTNVQTCSTIQITLKQEYGVYSHFTGHSKLVGLKKPVDVILMYTTLNKNKGIPGQLKLVLLKGPVDVQTWCTALNYNMGMLTFYRPVKTDSPQGASRCYADIQKRNPDYT